MRARDENGFSERDNTIHQIALFMGIDDNLADVKMRRSARIEDVSYNSTTCVDKCTQKQHFDINYIFDRTTIKQFCDSHKKGTYLVATLSDELPFLTIIDGDVQYNLDVDTVIIRYWKKD